MLVKYEDWDSDTSAATAGAFDNSTTVGINWFYDDTSKLQINYVAKKEEASESENDELLLQMQLSF